MGTRTDRSERLIGGSVRPPPTRGAIRRRRWMVGTGKRMLPLAALALLALVALWPEFSREVDQARRLARGRGGVPENGQLVDARYHGEDDHGQPYTITADSARQVTPDRVDMTMPVGDISMNAGSWIHVQSQTGVYIQKAAMLDLSGEVTLYRDDGTVLRTDAATMDLHEGAASSAAPTHVEGPFGTLDAQGFTLTDRGGVAFFNGPGHLVMNGKAP